MFSPVISPDLQYAEGHSRRTKPQRTSPLTSPFRQVSLVSFATSSLWTSLEPEKVSHRCKGLVSYFEELCHGRALSWSQVTAMLLNSIDNFYLTAYIHPFSHNETDFILETKSQHLLTDCVSILRPEEVGSKNE